jgi:hypothetical protein
MFTIRDQSKERLQAVVLKTFFKIAEKDISQTDILRMACNLLNDLDKDYVFNNVEDQEDIEDFNEKSQISNSKFIAKHRASELLQVQKNDLALKSYMLILKKQMKAYRRFCRILRILRHIRLMLFEESIMAKPINLPKGKNESRILLDEFYSLIRYRRNLIKSIEERQFAILASRKYQIKRVIHLICLPQYQGADFFKGMSLQNQIQFIKGYFKIKEREIIINTQIEKTIHDVLEKKAKEAQADNTVIKSYELNKTKPQLSHLQAKTKQIRVQTLVSLKQLGNETGNFHVNNAVSDVECLEKCRDFENHPIIKEPLQTHLALVKEQTVSIENEKKQLLNINKELNVLRNSPHLVVMDDLADDFESILEDLEMDADMELSELSDISLLDNLTKSPR